MSPVVVHSTMIGIPCIALYHQSTYSTDRQIIIEEIRYYELLVDKDVDLYVSNYGRSELKKEGHRR
jgi:hypothetical protein